MAKKSFPVWATFFTLISALILCSLGAWQLIRLEWKNNLLAGIDKEYSKDITKHQLGYFDFEYKRSHLVKRGMLTGVFSDEDVIAIHNTSQKYDIYVPLYLEGARHYILVCLGESSTKDIQIPRGSVTIGGIAMWSGKSWSFGIKNDPDNGQWVYLDMGDIRSFTKKDIYGMVFYSETVSPDIEGVSQKVERFQPNNNHLKYAVFWFTMCFVMLVVYYKRFFSKA